MRPLPIDEYEAMPMRVHRPDVCVMAKYAEQQSRGYRREPTSFTRADIDEVAPLTDADRAAMRNSREPPPIVQEHVQARIDAARQLKYRDHHGET